MIAREPLSMPVRGDVSRDGRLLFADDVLRRWHYRAGGRDGEAIAIPGLAALASLTLRLNMRLSRAVLIADDEEAMELWVDAFAEGDVARMSITSWRSLPGHNFDQEIEDRNQSFDDLETDSVLHFDDGLRLLRVAGELVAGLDRADFGKLAAEILPRLVEEPKDVEPILEAMQANRVITNVLVRAGGLLSGRPQQSRDGTRALYECRLTSSKSRTPDTASADPASSGILFGRQLAPVLQQPLGRIIANAETIGNELNGPIRENYALYAKDIADAARHLATLVDDLGDLEAVEGADFVVAPDDIELGDLARRVAGLLALKAADHSIRILTPAETERAPAIAEFRRVLQILLNLVTNAIRYSSDGTEITISIAQMQNMSQISVSDQGEGIAENDRERVFEKFERLGRSGDGGSGLGLYISRKLARAMGGDLTVDASSGGGAIFTLRLPATNQR